jgi:hypothetical protein
VVCVDGVRIVGSMDWEWGYDDMVSIENLWVDPEYRSTPRVLLMLIRHFKERCPDAQEAVQLSCALRSTRAFVRS